MFQKKIDDDKGIDDKDDGTEDDAEHALYLL